MVTITVQIDIVVIVMLIATGVVACVVTRVAIFTDVAIETDVVPCVGYIYIVVVSIRICYRCSGINVVLGILKYQQCYINV